MPSAARLAGLSGAALFATLLACGGAPFPRETVATNARIDDPWLLGARCPSGPAADLTGMRIEDLAAGSGKMVGDGDTVRVHYVARLADGTVVHDTDHDTPPIEMIIGSTKVICGFEKGLIGMHAGAQRRITVPARLAFGDEGKPPSVPPGSSLVFVVDLFVPAELSSVELRSPGKAPAAGRGGGGGGAGGRPGH
jgi:hypothetical protein